MQVVTIEGENLGVLRKQEALQAAKDRGMDLVLIAPEINPPVAKILDFSKFLYDEKKKKSATKAKKSKLKEIRFGQLADKGELDRYTVQARGFIEDGHRVKITVRMRGRQNLHPEISEDKILSIAKAVEDIAKQENAPKRIGNRVEAVLVRK
jgi:translation initiation factor IF-3